MPLPKIHAEAGRASVYLGYFYPTAFAYPAQGVEVVSVKQVEEASSACWKPQHMCIIHPAIQLADMSSSQGF